MRRLFDEHIKRKVTYLDGDWDFIADPENIGEENKYYTGFNNGKSVIVPSVWNSYLGMASYEGVCWYQKEFYFEGTARLMFEAVMTECKVWLDGEYLGYHYGGFCQFDFIVPDLKAGVHKLVLKVDNSFDEVSIPQQLVDWYHYGGINRSISVEKLNGLTVLYGKFDYNLSEDRKSADVFFTAELYGADKKKDNLFTVKLNDKVIYSETLSLRKGTSHTVVSKKIKIDDIKLWDVGEPNLYDIVFETDTDDLYDRVGFRTVEVKDCAVLLNGKKINFRGVNRHEDNASLGMAVPEKSMVRDLDIIEDLGCNAIRGSHYTNARIFLDMMDERGFLFWSEIPIWGGGFSNEALADKKVLERGLDMHKEMVKYYYNHPCIIFWGMHNEINTDHENGYEMSKLYYNFLKQHANNRLVTYATFKFMEDTCYEFCDVIGINAYYGWYFFHYDEWENFPDKFNKKRIESGCEHKPLIMSEFGAAAAYGHHTFKNLHWTEEYQANVLSKAIDVFRRCPYIIGTFIWQFCDSRSDMSIAKYRSFNNKGIIDRHRNPKMAYYAVKKLYHKYKNEDNENQE